MKQEIIELIMTFVLGIFLIIFINGIFWLMEILI